jgi:predicted phosphoribosyltransferase
VTWLTRVMSGGLPVAEPVANALNADLGVIVVRKLGAPMNEECAIGAITASGVRNEASGSQLH